MTYTAFHPVRQVSIAFFVLAITIAGCTPPPPPATSTSGQPPTPVGVTGSVQPTMEPNVTVSATVQTSTGPSSTATAISTPTEQESLSQATATAEATASATAGASASATTVMALTPTPSPRLTSPLPMPPLPLETTFGVEMGEINVNGGLPQVRAAGTRWVRRAGIPWNAVEPAEGQRNWSALSGLESEFRTAADQGFKVIAVVRQTPAWAQAVPGHSCGPIRQDKLDAFASFMHDLVLRYAAPPYNVRYWEIWNEPDIDYHLVATNSLWGCWGDANDDYYGGGYYAAMLKAIYPQVKQASPESQVLVGGLLLDCDPRNPPVGKDCKPSRFFEGILRSGGGNYFDGVAFHAYDYYDQPTLGEYYNPGWHASSSTTGPVVGVKAEYLRELLFRTGIPHKYLINTEMALVCGTGTEPRCQTQDFQNTKAAYVVESYLTALTQGLRASIWYTLQGWRGSGLLNSQRQPTPAYAAYRYAAQQFAGVTDIRDLSLGNGVKAYELNRPQGHLWVLWSTDSASHSVVLPSTPQTETDLTGQLLPTASSIEIGPLPVYITW